MTARKGVALPRVKPVKGRATVLVALPTLDKLTPLPDDGPVR